MYVYKCLTRNYNMCRYFLIGTGAKVPVFNTNLEKVALRLFNGYIIMIVTEGFKIAKVVTVTFYSFLFSTINAYNCLTLQIVLIKKRFSGKSKVKSRYFETAK